MTIMFLLILVIGAGLATALFLLIKWVLSLRVVVPPNFVHIVQRAKVAKAYGKNVPGQESNAPENTYYKFPSWIPILGVVVVEFPVSVFDIELRAYEAYDVGRLPFLVDIKAFFRIDDPIIAASRISDFTEMNNQLTDIVRGAVRNLLATANLEEIMSERSEYGKKFTEGIQEQLKHWGVVAVKTIELMDVRDAPGERVIANIMEKKKSLIEKESRIEVANNNRLAQEAEIAAKRDVDLKDQQAQQDVGIKMAEVKLKTGVADEEATQKINEARKITAEKEMAVQQVNTVRLAEITKDAAIVKAKEDKEVIALKAEANFIDKEKNAKADFEIEKYKADGIIAVGKASATAEDLMQKASVQSQIALAKEIGGNKEYQQYLISIETVKANQEVGVAYAASMKDADVKIIANAGNAAEGIGSIKEIVSPKGGLAVGSALEAFTNTDIGKAVVDKLLKTKPNDPSSKEG